MAHFRNLYRHGFARVCAFAPKVELADPDANAQTLIALAQRAHKDQSCLALFPELSLSGYSLDDLHSQSRVIQSTQTAILSILKASQNLMPVLVFGAALQSGDQLFNCALIVHKGQILGVIPKTFLPNYREFYEKRWFSDSSGRLSDVIQIAGIEAPFGTDLVFQATDLPGFRLAAEICEDFWSPTPPSTHAALAGATILANLSASNAMIGKSRERKVLCDAHSRRTMSAYIFAASGAGESTTDLAWDGQLLAYENGRLLAEGERFSNTHACLTTEIDLDLICADRLRNSTWRDGIARDQDRLAGFRRIEFTLGADLDLDLPLMRNIDRFPFVPNDAAQLDEDCYEAYNIQVQGLTQRLKASGVIRAVIGVSGGLDSTQALIVCAQAFDRLGWDRSDILAYTLPGFASSDAIKAQAIALISRLGVTHRDIDIRPMAEQMLSNLDHPYSKGSDQFDITFENVQAGLRTDYLFRAANHENGMVIGTGDLSELALGWCTYGVGDQMSHYNVNAGLAKTLIQHLIAWLARREEFGRDVSETLFKILGTEISPELVPAGQDGAIQSTQDRIGPYPLQDFTLHYIARYGFTPRKIVFMAEQAWSLKEKGQWPAHIRQEDKTSYCLKDIVEWMEVFCKRFFQTSQFKRSAMPNGPKLTSAGALSPRGDWRMPSDSSAKLWLSELEDIKSELGL